MGMGWQLLSRRGSRKRGRERTRGSGLARTSESKLARICRATSLRLNAFTLKPPCAGSSCGDWLDNLGGNPGGAVYGATSAATGRTLQRTKHGSVS